MNACHDCTPTHNRDVREQGRCWCPCHSPQPRDSYVAAPAGAATAAHGDDPLDHPCPACGAPVGFPCTADLDGRVARYPHGVRSGAMGPPPVRCTVVVDVTDDPDELADALRRLADRLDRTPWPPENPTPLLDRNGNRCGALTLEELL